MKRSVKNLLLIVTGMVLTFGLSSCSKDGYSSNDFSLSLATIHTGNDGNAESFILDNGKTMFVAATGTAYKPKNERAVIHYTILADNYSGYDYDIKLNDYVEDVQTSPIIYVPKSDTELQNGLGYDKIKVFAMWAKVDYITIRLGYKTSSVDQHMLNLVAVDENKVQQGDTPIKLEFRHNKGKNSENYPSSEKHVSFKLDEYIAANRGNTNLDFEITWVEYDGTEKTYTLNYPLSSAVVNPSGEGIN